MGAVVGSAMHIVGRRGVRRCRVPGGMTVGPQRRTVVVVSGAGVGARRMSMGQAAAGQHGVKGVAVAMPEGVAGRGCGRQSELALRSEVHTQWSDQWCDGSGEQGSVGATAWTKASTSSL